MNLHLHNRVVLVTGASGGIGRALAEVLRDEGAHLVLTGHSQFPALAEWAAEHAPDALCVRADITDPAAIAHAARAGAERFGRVDACVANAGAYPATPQGLHEADIDRVRRTIEVNLLGTMWTARAFLAEVARQSADGVGASLVLIGSTAGEFGEAFHSDYAAAKAGMVGLMRSLKNEIVHLDPYGRVNLVQPGWTVTHMARESLSRPGAIDRIVRTMPLRQLARAVDVARTTAFLCSDAARHLSGQTITVAGGMEGRMLWDGADEDAVRRRLTE